MYVSRAMYDLANSDEVRDKLLKAMEEAYESHLRNECVYSVYLDEDGDVWVHEAIDSNEYLEPHRLDGRLVGPDLACLAQYNGNHVRLVDMGYESVDDALMDYDAFAALDEALERLEVITDEDDEDED
jgi:hypothetical protein